MSLAIGIDLGTTNTVVAVWRGGRAEVIPGSGGARLTPSVVAYGAGAGAAPLVGHAAVDQAPLNPKNTIYDVKRLMGRRWDDRDVQRDAKAGRWPFQVAEEVGRACVVVQEGGRSRRLLPEQVSAAVLSYVRDAAEASLGQSVRDAVVTVPAYFTNAQRQATKDACSVAGLRALRIINEPTAAALAYGLAEPSDDERIVLVYDWGGGTLDVSILSIEEGVFEVRATAGDTRLGGIDLDSALADYLAVEFEQRTGQDPRQQPKALRRLLTAAEKAKCALSETMETRVELDALLDGKTLQVTVTRARFEQLFSSILSRALAPVSLALRDAGLQAGDVQELLLVGGSTRIPALRERLREMFPGIELRQVVSPDEAVALGAAAQAALLSGDRSETITDLVLVDVTPLSLGIESNGGIMSIIIPRNTTIPCSKTSRHVTVNDFQKRVAIKVYEGERSMSKDNNLLSKFRLEGIWKAPRGAAKIDVTFDLDADGILYVSAVETRSKVQHSITVDNERGRLTSEQIQKFVLEAEMNKASDEAMRADAEARNDLEYSCYKLKKKAESSETAEYNRKMILDECNRTMAWLESAKDASKEDCAKKKYELELTCEMILTNF